MGICLVGRPKIHFGHLTAVHLFFILLLLLLLEPYRQCVANIYDVINLVVIVAERCAVNVNAGEKIQIKERKRAICKKNEKKKQKKQNHLKCLRRTINDREREFSVQYNAAGLQAHKTNLSTKRKQQQQQQQQQPQATTIILKKYTHASEQFMPTEDDFHSTCRRLLRKYSDTDSCSQTTRLRYLKSVLSAVIVIDMEKLHRPAKTKKMYSKSKYLCVCSTYGTILTLHRVQCNSIELSEHHIPLCELLSYHTVPSHTIPHTVPYTYACFYMRSKFVNNNWEEKFLIGSLNHFTSLFVFVLFSPKQLRSFSAYRERKTVECKAQSVSML
uniref:Uncharacterized protein n=1 Tax=Glossina brevipalpis TaxID=37001 RepID=A0A1A9WQL1_9MUSC